MNGFRRKLRRAIARRPFCNICSERLSPGRQSVCRSCHDQIIKAFAELKDKIAAMKERGRTNANS